ARCSLNRPRHDADRCGGRTPYDRPPPRRGRKERFERTPSQVLLRCGRGVECLEDLRLQARLLVEADLQVREEGELRAPLRIAFEPNALVMRKRLAQQA